MGSGISAGDCGSSTETPPGLSALGASSALSSKPVKPAASRDEPRRTGARLKIWLLTVRGSCIGDGPKGAKRRDGSRGAGWWHGSDKKMGSARWKSEQEKLVPSVCRVPTERRSSRVNLGRGSSVFWGQG